MKIANCTLDDLDDLVEVSCFQPKEPTMQVFLVTQNKPVGYTMWALVTAETVDEAISVAIAKTAMAAQRVVNVFAMTDERAFELLPQLRIEAFCGNIAAEPRRVEVERIEIAFLVPPGTSVARIVMGDETLYAWSVVEQTPGTLPADSTGDFAAFEPKP
jgi:hypothetical protein